MAKRIVRYTLENWVERYIQDARDAEDVTITEAECARLRDLVTYTYSQESRPTDVEIEEEDER
jgi:hypothetical protein